MPEMDDRFAMHAYRYGYSSTHTGLVPLRHPDRRAPGTCDRGLHPGAGVRAALARRRRGRRLLLSVVTRPDNRADLLILDAMDLEAEPLAVVRLPFGQAWLFHGCWREEPPGCRADRARRPRSRSGWFRDFQPEQDYKHAASHYRQWCSRTLMAQRLVTARA